MRENIAGGAVEGLAERIECAESDGFCVPVFQDRQVGWSYANFPGEFCDSDATRCHDFCEVDADCHLDHRGQFFAVTDGVV